MDEARIEEAVAVVQSLLEERLGLATDAELQARVFAMQKLRAAVDAAHLATVAELTEREVPAHGARRGKATQRLLERMNLGRAAARDVACAQALASELPEMAKAYAAGEISRGHVEAAERVINKVPVHLRLVGPTLDGLVTQWAREHAPAAVRDLGRDLLAGLDPDGADRFDSDAHARRAVTMSYTPALGLFADVQIPGVGGADVFTALQHASKPDPAQYDAQGALIPDLRTAAQRRADAFVAICRVYLAHCRETTRMERPHVLVVATPEQVAGAKAAGEAVIPGSDGLVPDEMFRQMLCDSVLQAVVLGESGEVLKLGRTHRTASKQQRRALAARDLGCVIPGCGAPPGWCDAHHVRYWSEGGPTDIENLALLCPRHHKQVHQGIWQLTVIDKVPHAIPPPSIDPDRIPRRNTRLRDLADARRLGEQLRLPDAS